MPRRPRVTPSDPLTRILRAAGTARAGSSDYDLNPGVTLPEGRRLRPAAVLVAVDTGGDAPRVILTMRSSVMRHHPGQIAFPGGKQDAGDPDLHATALREAHEEIGLAPGSVEILADLPRHETVTGFDVTPVLARVTAPFTAVAEPGEVAEVFAVPLAHVLDPGRFRVEQRRWKGTWRRYYTVPFGPYYIWGATARILRVMADMAGRS
ncbi:CoA pyrophosphatase [Roseovarius ramblicola]|uniref:CoA pyrophosphatase n=1 Tax=Roseovarius ramblicola TaxID=2022336 RepID=A0ABV5HXI2_9RHOB